VSALVSTAMSWRSRASGGAAPATVLLAAVLLALAWANASPGTYTAVWDARAVIGIADHRLELSLREWVNSGLMSFFFFLVGLEARREVDLGELRQRRRMMLPLALGTAGMAIPAVIYLVVTAGTPATGAWGMAMSTDSAFALGVLALVAGRAAAPIRSFLLTMLVVDDVVALVVLTVLYSREVDPVPVAAAVGVFATVLVLRARRLRRGQVYFALGVLTWILLLASGVETVVIGLAMGLVTYAYNPPRDALEQAHERFIRFREQPTPRLAQEAQRSVAATLSSNERLQLMYEPWVNRLIVPLFAVANAGIPLDPQSLRRALSSPITLGVLAAYVIGKPLGITAAAAAVTASTRGRIRPPVGWAAVLGSGTVCGIGFTVSLLVAGLALTGSDRQEAVVGVLAAALLSTLLTVAVFRATAALPTARKVRALLGSADPLIDLSPSVDPDRDHIRGAESALVTVVEYGDYQCEYCGRAEPEVRALLDQDADVRYVWRHLPLTDIHPQAELAARAAEAADRQGAFWAMHDLLMSRQDQLLPEDLIRHADELGLDTERFVADLARERDAARVAEDVASADLSGVAGTPTFFVNGRRHYGSYDAEALSRAVRLGRARATALLVDAPDPAPDVARAEQ